MHIGLVDLHWEGHHTPYVAHLSRSLINDGHKVTFVTDKRHGRLDKLPTTERFSVRTCRYPQVPHGTPFPGTSIYGQFVRLRQIRGIFETARRADVDLIHFLLFDRTQLPLYLASLFDLTPDIPIFGTLHHDMFTGDYETGEQSVIQRTVSFALSQTLESGVLAGVFVHATSMRERILSSSPISPADVTVVPAPTPDPPELSTNEARRRLDLPLDGPPMLLFFGELREEKGPDLLAQALRNLGRRLNVVYAGSLSDYTPEEFEHWCEEADDQITIVDRLEFVPEDEVDLYFAAADALVLPYRRRRGISGPLRRAVAVGTPVIGPSQTDIGEIIDRNSLGPTFAYDSVTALRDTLRSVDLASDWDPPQEFIEERQCRTAGQKLIEAYQA